MVFLLYVSNFHVVYLRLYNLIHWPVRHGQGEVRPGQPWESLLRWALLTLILRLSCWDLKLTMVGDLGMGHPLLIALWSLLLLKIKIGSKFQVLLLCMLGFTCFNLDSKFGLSNISALPLKALDFLLNA